MAGLVMIVLAIFVAIFGYLIAPDPSPFANRIILEIGGQKPGFEQTFVLQKKEGQQNTSTLFERIAEGRRDDFEYIPITTWQQAGDSIIVEKFIDRLK